jgi:hypothetical protein
MLKAPLAMLFDAVRHAAQDIVLQTCFFHPGLSMLMALLAMLFDAVRHAAQDIVLQTKVVVERAKYVDANQYSHGYPHSLMKLLPKLVA